MAKAAEQTPVKKGGMKSIFVLAIVSVAAVGGGAAVPFAYMSLKADAAHEPSAKSSKDNKALVPFGDAVVNLCEGKQTRYLRVKLILVVDESQEKEITDLVAKKKAFLKNWLLSYLKECSLDDVNGAAGVNRLRREIRDEFNRLLFPDGPEKISDVLFEEFVVQ